jgi:hypothetical protein
MLLLLQPAIRHCSHDPVLRDRKRATGHYNKEEEDRCILHAFCNSCCRLILNSFFVLSNRSVGYIQARGAEEYRSTLKIDKTHELTGGGGGREE